jgi:hypothetical protein
MFDEEVKFSLVDANKEKLDSALTRLYKTMSVVGGGVAGYLALKTGLELNQFYSALFGIPTGMVLGAQTFNVVKIMHKSRLEEKVSSDQEEINDNNKSVVFEYRGNSLSCIIEPEHETNGKIFYMNINDEAIIDPAFSYQPSRKSLGFKFSVHKYGSIHGGAAAFFGSIGNVMKRISRDVPGEEWKREQEEDYEKEPLHKRLSRELLKRLEGKDTYKLGFEMDSESIYIHLKYQENDFDSHLEEFGKLASSVMNSASGFKRRENFSEEEN